MGWISLTIWKSDISFCLCNPFNRLPAMSITFWINVYSIIKLLSFYSTSVARFSGSRGDFVFNCILPILVGSEQLSNSSITPCCWVAGFRLWARVAHVSTHLTILLLFYQKQLVVFNCSLTEASPHVIRWLVRTPHLILLAQSPQP